MLKKILNFLFPQGRRDWDTLQEGIWADEYTDQAVRDRIRSQYYRHWQPEITPLTEPLKFNPLRPPQGWRYDPYYETWIKIS